MICRHICINLILCVIVRTNVIALSVWLRYCRLRDDSPFSAPGTATDPAIL